MKVDCDLRLKESDKEREFVMRVARLVDIALWHACISC